MNLDSDLKNPKSRFYDPLTKQVVLFLSNINQVKKCRVGAHILYLQKHI